MLEAHTRRHALPPRRLDRLAFTDSPMKGPVPYTPQRPCSPPKALTPVTPFKRPIPGEKALLSPDVGAFLNV